MSQDPLVGRCYTPPGALSATFIIPRLPCVKGAPALAGGGLFATTTLPPRLRRATSPYTGEALSFLWPFVGRLFSFKIVGSSKIFLLKM